jgi:hypothetical protein
VGTSLFETIGCILLPGLCVLGKPYSLGIFGLLTVNLASKVVLNLDLIKFNVDFKYSPYSTFLFAL